MRKVAVVVILGSIVSLLDTTIVNVALGTLGRELDASLSEIQWVASGYLLSLSAVIPVTGWATRRFGGRSVYIAALTVFTVGSALCALASSPGELIAMRVIQGLGGGMLVPTSQIILLSAAGPQNAARVLSVIGVPIVLAPVFGPTIGGLLLDHVGWQAIFLVNVPIGIVALAAAARFLPRSEGKRDDAKLDLRGLLLVSIGVTAIIYGLTEIGVHGQLADAKAICSVASGLVLVGAFAARSVRIDRPLLDIRLYSIGSFRAASVTTLCLGAAMFGSMILMPLYFQVIRNQSAVDTGLLLIPLGVGAGIATWFSGAAATRFGGGLSALAGVILAVVGTLPLIALTRHTSYLVIGAALFVRGLGFGMWMMPSMSAAFSVLRSDQVGDAAPQLLTLQRLGGSFGIALVAVVLQHYLGGAVPLAGWTAASFGRTFAWVAVITAVALVPTLALARVERRARLSHPGGEPVAARSA